MSKRVVSGLAPAGKPHPATKWSLLMALLVVVVLGVPRVASAGTPTVHAPTGPETDNVFTAAYTFDTYISCTGGPSYNWQYSDYRLGSNTYTFYGASDGSLLVDIDTGGMISLQSCGNPYSGDSEIASYTVVAGTPPSPTPSPTPPPTPNPTPHPTPHATPRPSGPSGPSNGGGSSSNPASSQNSSGSSSASQSSPPSSSGPAPIALATAPTPSPDSANLAKPKARPSVAGAASSSASPISLALSVTLLGSLLVLTMLVLLVRTRRFREWLSLKWAHLMTRAEPYWFKIRHSLARSAHVHGQDQLKRGGLSPHHHSGKIMAHHHTSYAALAFLLLLSFVLAGAATLSTRADSVSSSILSLTVTGPPPATAATITSPTSGQTFTDATQTVLGTCPSGLFVEIWINGSFSGDSDCDVNDLYNVLVTLTPGEDDLIARDVDGLGQYGPDSATTVVYYTPPPPPPSPSPSPTPGQSPSSKTSSSKPVTLKPAAATSKSPSPLKLSSSQHYYQGASVGQAVPWSVNLAGGTAPYTLTWEWGDGKSDTTFANSPGIVKDQHNYAKPGIYQLTIRVQDADRQQAALQLVVVVNGPVTSASLGQSSGDPGNLVAVWPLLTITSLVVLSMWLGEHHKLTLLRPVSV